MCSFQEILSYVEKQFDNVLNEESRVKRNTKSVDSRVHVILYFLTPNGHGLREVDIVFMRKLGTRANIIPVISKSDTLTPKELRDFKAKVCLEDKILYTDCGRLESTPTSLFQFSRV